MREAERGVRGAALRRALLVDEVGSTCRTRTPFWSVPRPIARLRTDGHPQETRDAYAVRITRRVGLRGVGLRGAGQSSSASSLPCGVSLIPG